MIHAGVDAGSRAVKIVLLNEDGLDIAASGVVDQGVDQDAIAGSLFDRLLREQDIARQDVTTTVATGYGRNAVGFAGTTITEITCQAVGVRHVMPEARTIIDIGGQDSKLIQLTDSGTVRDFVMNDRCAAGTGRFLEVVAERLGVRLQDLGREAARSRNPAAISSMCVVFAETEIVGLLASGTLAEDIVAGVEVSIASRLSAMSGSAIMPPVVFSGGVALIDGMDRALAKTLGHHIAISPIPQLTAALGAAILATRQ